MYNNLPVSDAEVFHTAEQNTPYLKEPGVAMMAATACYPENIKPFLAGFDKELGYEDYLTDLMVYVHPAEHITKISGQLCYLSFDRNRTRNDEVWKYLDNIKSSGHGSVLEHANYSFLCWGISRSLTHELVRHRAGVAYSQVSQRYVAGQALRFVERPEYQKDEALHQMFEDRIDKAVVEYNATAAQLMKLQGEGVQLLTGEKKRDLRKKVNQCARSVLPNETEAPIMFTANVRALRHILEMRASGPAEIEIRRLTYKIYSLVKLISPNLFNDYTIEELPDGTPGLKTQYRKV